MDMFFFRRHLLISTFFTLLIIAEHQPAYAHCHDRYQSFCTSTNNRWLLGGGVGGVERSWRTSTSIDNGTPVPAPYNQDIFTIQRPSNNAIITLFGGYQWKRLNTLLPYYSLSLHYEHQFSSAFKGTVQQYGLPQFINYNYSMRLNASIINIVGKVNLVEYKSFLPYLSAGVGAAFNRVSGYREQAIPPVDPPRVSPNYASETNINFAYTLGAGIDYIFCENVWFTLGYEYLDLGKANSGQGSGSWSGTRLDFGKVHTNTLSGTVTYLF